MTEDEIPYAASRALAKIMPGAVVLSVERLPQKPLGWVIVFDGRSVGRSRLVFEHRDVDDGGEMLTEKIRAGLGALRRRRGVC